MDHEKIKKQLRRIAESQSVEEQDIRELFRKINDIPLNCKIMFFLTQYAKERVIDVLINILKEDTPGEKYKAVIALGVIGDERGIIALVELAPTLENGETTTLNKCFEVLERYVKKGTVPAEMLFPLLYEEFMVRERAATVLKEFGLEKIDPYERMLCRLLLKETGEEIEASVEDIPALCKCLKNQDREIIVYAANVLGDIGNEDVVPHLMAAVEGAKRMIARMRVRDAVAKIGERGIDNEKLTKVFKDFIEEQPRGKQKWAREICQQAYRLIMQGNRRSRKSMHGTLSEARVKPPVGREKMTLWMRRKAMCK